MTHNKKPEILGVRTAARSRLFHIEAVKLRFANGSEREYERIAGAATPGAVIIVAMPDPSTILLVREYAVGLERYELSLPAGRIEAGESALQAANRELIEETGHAAHRLQTLRTLSLAPCIFSYQTEIVLATDLYPCSLQGDEPEPLQVVPWSVHRFGQLLATAEICEARTLAALYLAREHLLQKPAKATAQGPQQLRESHCEATPLPDRRSGDAARRALP